MMKTLTKLLLFAAFTSLVFSCSKSDSILNDLSDTGLKSAQPKTVTVPFKADVQTNNTFVVIGMATDPIEPILDFTFTGTGIASHMGEIMFSAEFLVKPVLSDVFYQKTPTGKEVLTAANGDELWVSMGSRIGNVVPVDENDPAGYYEKLNTEVDVTGGTGRFEGASGTLRVKGYLVAPLARASWLIYEGDLVLVRGNR
jgi:hypothetical protein